MKKLTILLFSILISFNSYGEWAELAQNGEGDTFYIDADTIRENGGYVYYWELIDLIQPDEWGDMSVKIYIQGDCLVNRFIFLSSMTYKQSMGGGSGETMSPPDEWQYPVPESVDAHLLDEVCRYVD
ncbi:MAG TPA: hypothetical protein EYG35_03240 [Gammaproteobacteria bacterium]|jgi:hypothetical protein|nr:hypothetical protein [Gammaproteobacteria bacterium]